MELVKAFKDPYKNNAPSELWKFEDVNAKPRQQGGGRWAADPIVDSLISRYLDARPLEA